MMICLLSVMMMIMMNRDVSDKTQPVSKYIKTMTRLNEDEDC